MLRDLLESVFRFAGFDVIASETIADAIPRIAARRPDAIVTELFSPTYVEPEWAALDRLRVAAKSVPIVILTTNTRVRPHDARAHGCAAIVTKPFEVDHLIGRVRKVLNGVKTPSQAIAAG